MEENSEDNGMKSKLVYWMFVLLGIGIWACIIGFGIVGHYQQSPSLIQVSEVVRNNTIVYHI
jgi:hypothetical protein